MVHGGQKQFFLKVDEERRSAEPLQYILISSSDAAQTPGFDYLGRRQAHKNNMTPRGRRLGPEGCVKGITCSSRRREVHLPDTQGFDKGVSQEGV